MPILEMDWESHTCRSFRLRCSVTQRFAWKQVGQTIWGWALGAVCQSFCPCLLADSAKATGTAQATSGAGQKALFVALLSPQGQLQISAHHTCASMSLSTDIERENNPTATKKPIKDSWKGFFCWVNKCKRFNKWTSSSSRHFNWFSIYMKYPTVPEEKYTYSKKWSKGNSSTIFLKGKRKTQEKSFLLFIGSQAFHSFWSLWASARLWWKIWRRSLSCDKAAASDTGKRDPSYWDVGLLRQSASLRAIHVPSVHNWTNSPCAEIACSQKC